MTAIESSTDVSLANLAPDFKQTDLAEKLQNRAEQNKQLLRTEDSINVSTVSDKDKNSVKADKDPELSSQQLEKVAQQLQDFVGEMNRGLEFTVDKDSGRDVIKVIDKSSGDLVKQYPSEEVLTLVSKLSDMVGGFIDAKV